MRHQQCANRNLVAIAMVVTLSGVPLPRIGSLAAQTVDLPPNLKTVVYRNAPFIVHETNPASYPPGAIDHLLKVDFDGTYDGTTKEGNRNYDYPNAGRAASVYFSATENGYYSDQGYYFLGYYFYHPHDDGDGHEHDMEGVYFIVKKSAYTPYGTPVIALGQAHGEMIPYVNVHQSLVSPSANGDPFWGLVEFWNDSRYNAQRPIAVIRSEGHAARMAQTQCKSWSMEGSVDSLTLADHFPTCMHEGFDNILYRPMMEEATTNLSLPQADALPLFQYSGSATYQLIDVSTTLWPLRNVPADYLFSNGGGTSLQLSGGATAQQFFKQATFSNNHANPLWFWRGGDGCQQHFGIWGCWYGFDVDGYWYSFNPPRHWPTSATPGAFLTDPTGDAILRFVGLPGIDYPMRYNPYIVAKPNYYGPQPFDGYIVGPQTANTNGGTQYWSAAPRFGVAPYTYLWSGAVSGTTAYASGIVENQYIYLDMWDAVGQHVSTSIYVQWTGCPPEVETC